MNSHPIPEMHEIGSHFTASAVVIFKGNILLIDHRRIEAWVPPGGHINEGELPHHAAIREVFEETGVAVEVICEELPVTGDSDAFFLPSPLCMHAVKAVEKAEPLYHLDIAYLCRPLDCKTELPIITDVSEVKAAAWVPLTELGKLRLAKNVPEMVQYALKRLG